MITIQPKICFGFSALDTDQLPVFGLVDVSKSTHPSFVKELDLNIYHLWLYAHSRLPLKNEPLWVPFYILTNEKQHTMARVIKTYKNVFSLNVSIYKWCSLRFVACQPYQYFLRTRKRAKVHLPKSEPKCQSWTKLSCDFDLLKFHSVTNLPCFQVWHMSCYNFDVIL